MLSTVAFWTHPSHPTVRAPNILPQLGFQNIQKIPYYRWEELGKRSASQSLSWVLLAFESTDMHIHQPALPLGHWLTLWPEEENQLLIPTKFYTNHSTSCVDNRKLISQCLKDIKCTAPLNTDDDVLQAKVNISLTCNHDFTDSYSPSDPHLLLGEFSVPACAVPTWCTGAGSSKAWNTLTGS